MNDLHCVPAWGIAHGSYSPQERQYHPEDVITYNCENHYYISGSHIRSCTVMGTWDTEKPQCNPILCFEMSFTYMDNMAVNVD